MSDTRIEPPIDQPPPAEAAADEAAAPTTAPAIDAAAPPPQADQRPAEPSAMRERVEIVAMAVMTVLLFRTFFGEPFVIPTGSMAPTLVGRHVDVTCRECGYTYQAGASEENNEQGKPEHLVPRLGYTTCPQCGYRMRLDRASEWSNQNSFSGDRIIVSKFAYDLEEPQRWDVFVFKYPGNAKQNYIKRLVGLPGETIRIEHGDIFTRPHASGPASPAAPFEIARKPPHKLAAMLQPVHDTRFVSPLLESAGWPSRWREWGGQKPRWQETTGAAGRTYTIDGGREVAWLRYRHLLPLDRHWEALEAWTDVGKINEIDDPAPIERMLGTDAETWGDDRGGAAASETENRLSSLKTLLSRYDADGDGELDRLEKSAALADLLPPRLITDAYAYNAAEYSTALSEEHEGPGVRPVTAEPLDRKFARGVHWVGDLAVECDVTVESEGGELLLDLVEGGMHFTCRIDLSTGGAVLSYDGGRGRFLSSKKGDGQAPTAASGVRGPGQYRLRFANCDDELRLWVDGGAVKFSSEARYQPGSQPRPAYDDDDPGDAEPAGIGCQGARLAVTRLKVLRDIYYIATESSAQHATDYRHSPGIFALEQVLSDPSRWSQSDLFAPASLRHVEFRLGKDQFFPLGDNSPSSQDARMWRSEVYSDDHPYVDRKLLTGKAVLIYWPHAWNNPLMWPNFERMGLIR